MAKTNNRNSFRHIRSLGLLSLFFYLFGANFDRLLQRAEAFSSRESLIVSCAPEQPVIYSGETISVYVWVTDVNGKPLANQPTFVWEASDGSITGKEHVSWTFGNNPLLPNGVVTATAKVTVHDPKLGAGSCAIRIFLQRIRLSGINTPPPLRSLRLSGRAMLLSSFNEPTGYGLYSYLLFDTPPRNEVERDRYLKALESYLLMLQSIEELELYQRRSNLNLTLLPVKKAIDLPDELSTTELLAKAAERVLANYDYARASTLLAAIGNPPLQGGPFMVAMKPAAAESAAVYLFLDMSRVTPKLVWDWIRAFCGLAAQTPSWSEVEVTKLALNTRNAIAVAARNTPEVLGSLQQWIRIFKPG